jgi:hypothetical protein
MLLDELSIGLAVSTVCVGPARLARAGFSPVELPSRGAGAAQLYLGFHPYNHAGQFPAGVESFFGCAIIFRTNVG